jgi:hypothetical protein
MPDAAGIGIAAIDVPDPVTEHDFGRGFEGDVACFHGEAEVTGRGTGVAITAR